MLGETKTIEEIASSRRISALAMTKYIFYAIMALFFIGVIFVSSNRARAADDHIVINEIYPNPNSGEDEWIELYNPSGESVDLYTLVIWRNETTSNFKNLSDLSCRNFANFYYVCELSSNWLYNTEVTITLKEDFVQIDQVSYADFGGAKGKSFSRIPNGSDANDDDIDFRILKPTPGTENILPVYSNSIIINEIIPQPANGSLNEFTELYNTGSSDIDLSSWQIDDIASGGSSPFTIPTGTTIAAGGYLSFYNSVDHISYNDSSDTARLIDPNGDEKSTINYSSSKRGQSYSKFGDNWHWTTTLTPTVENILTVEIVMPDQDIPILETDIAGARSQPDGGTVSVVGTVSVQPGKLSSQYFYIQDGNSGIQIYNYNKFFPTLSVGDQIQVIGELGSTSNERRIKTSLVSDIIILSTHPPPEPIKATISDIAENYEGEYISVVGTVTRTSGNTFYIHGSGEIQVSIRSGTGIKKPTMHVGDRVQIAGILSQYGDSYRILPIVQSDVKIISSSGLPNSGPDGYVVIIISTILAWITQAILLRKQKKQLKYFYLKTPMQI